MGSRKSNTLGRPTVAERVAWILFQTTAIREANERWATRCREVLRISPAAGTPLLDRDRFAAGVWLRLRASLRPWGNRLPGARAEINRRLALLYATHPDAIDAAVTQYAGEVAECRLAEAGLGIGGGR